MKKQMLVYFYPLLCLLLISPKLFADNKEVDWAELSTCTANTTTPFVASGDYFGVWDGKDYTKLFIKGMNLGISKPGTLPGELAATREDYQRWFTEIKAMGYNTLRIYTLHFPHFYDELAKYNNAHLNNPLLVFHGIWLDETDDYDFYNQTTEFDSEIQRVVNAVHGNSNVDVRFGKAYGIYTADISKWVIGYIIGREVYPDEVKLVNQNHAAVTSYSGTHLSISNGSPSEVWITNRLDNVISYEYTNYATQRPVGFSSWPTLDPITHPTEALRFNGYEDSQSVDLTKISKTDAPAGYFISYHAYPYYPDFINDDPGYQASTDYLGPNSYLGYLADLKSHYQNIPLLIAEFGEPTSWGISRFAHSLMHHGGISEYQQGIYSIRMMKNIESVGAAGGIQFSWIDEWFKQNWRTNPLENADSRQRWHNLLNPEQNYGIVTFKSPVETQQTIGTYSGSIEKIKALANYEAFNITLLLKTEDHLNDTIWLALDTYDASLGESILPDGESITSNGNTLRAEYALQIIPNDTIARLYVTDAYDMYSIQGEPRIAVNESTPTDGAPWNIVRWKNKAYTNNIQYLGNLACVSSASSAWSFLKPITWNHDSISIKLPWTLINFKDPSTKKVMHYEGVANNGSVNEISTDRVSDGVAVTAVLNGQKFQTSRYTWNNWTEADVQAAKIYERNKQSVEYITDHLNEFNSAPVANCDEYSVNVGDYIEVNAANGLLANDVDFDNDYLEVVIPGGFSTMQGNLYVHPDGSFAYEPYETASGTDQFMYYATDGNKYSRLATVTFTLNTAGTSATTPVAQASAIVYPNPTSGQFQVRFTDAGEVSDVRISNATGMLVKQYTKIENNGTINIADQQPGIYQITYRIKDQVQTQKLIKY